MVSADDGEDVAGAEDLVFFVVELDLGPAVLTGQNDIADLDVEFGTGAVVVELAGAERDDLRGHGFFLRGVGDVDAALDLFDFFDGFHEDAIAQGLDFLRFYLSKKYIFNQHNCRYNN